MAATCGICGTFVPNAIGDLNGMIYGFGCPTCEFRKRQEEYQQQTLEELRNQSRGDKSSSPPRKKGSVTLGGLLLGVVAAVMLALVPGGVVMLVVAAVVVIPPLVAMWKGWHRTLPFWFLFVGWGCCLVALAHTLLFDISWEVVLIGFLPASLFIGMGIVIAYFRKATPRDRPVV